MFITPARRQRFLLAGGWLRLARKAGDRAEDERRHAIDDADFAILLRHALLPASSRLNAAADAMALRGELY